MVRITTGSQALDELLGGITTVLGDNNPQLVDLSVNLNIFSINMLGGIETSSITEAFGEFR